MPLPTLASATIYPSLVPFEATNVSVGRNVPPNAAGPDRTFCLPFAVQFGQWNPTEAWCMHDGQIGRSQR